MMMLSFDSFVSSFQTFFTIPNLLLKVTNHPTTTTTSKFHFPSSTTALQQQQSSSPSSPFSSLSDLFDTSIATSLSESRIHNLQLFQEYASKGLELFKKRDLKGSIQCLQDASAFNATQPNAQLGIFLYLDERYEEAAAQLDSDIKKIESSKSFKATDLRIWRSACLNKLGKVEESITSLDLLNIAVPEAKEDRILMNYTLQFFGRQKTLDEMIQFIEAVSDNDFTGRKFYGNFYLGLFYDSIGERDMSALFLSFPCKSRKFSDKDMWFHLPRIFFDCRFTSKGEEEQEVGG